MLHCLFAKREDGGLCEKRNVIQSNRWRLNNKFTRSYPKSLRELHNSKSRVLSDRFFALLQSPKFLVLKRIKWCICNWWLFWPELFSFPFVQMYSDRKQKFDTWTDDDQALTGTRGYSTTRFSDHYSYPTRKILLLDRVVE